MTEAKPVDVLQHSVFSEWLSALRDAKAKARIAIRIERLKSGNPGDCKSVGGGVHELRIDYGPGYRVYFTRRGNTIVVLLCGGDKSTQARDIDRAQHLAQEV
jgi:putative addiction module killer protein